MAATDANRQVPPDYQLAVENTAGVPALAVHDLTDQIR